MTHNAVVHDAYYYERIGFRGAWISVTQVPLVYLLASKSNIIGYITGSSHERLNWLHRWASRTLLVTVTVHGGFFWREWMRADFVKLELEMMPMVKYGLGTWAILVWTFLSSLSPLRRMAYEVFVLQHIAASVVILWLLYIHVPAYARYNIWFAIAAISSDRALRLCLFFYQNVTIRSSAHGSKVIGHRAQLEPAGDDISVLTIKGTHMSWKPGQHVYLWLPRVGLLEAHPYTIASRYTVRKDCTHNEIQLVVRTHSGFSRRLQRFSKRPGGSRQSLTAFVVGPYGASPRWDVFETLILISASTGSSFTLPILESVLNSQGTICARRIDVLLLARKRSHIETYMQRLSDALAIAKDRRIYLTVQIAITSDADDASSVFPRGSGDEEECCCSEKNLEKKKPSHCLTSINSHSSMSDRSTKSSRELVSTWNILDNAEQTCRIVWTCGRPNIAEFIRRPVEVSGGETSVAVCGGKPLVSKVRNTIANLSDERAVHKGTGAQGIYLHVEEFCY
ncbi:hypothetical protein B7463_g7416, partial [Scytalidium lignicola]